ncbi:hypothetical protein MRB53_034827 [Persea americana]|uniref:Uncharacterized protein n=1 Tax=Persea americana TaxID=3435 RepID=A0ACC2K2Z2_PERAE|nr:hypothetical protein MRB53_034827 [Persea americana]
MLKRNMKLRVDRHQRVEKATEETPINENEIRITSQGRMRNYTTYATTLLQEKGLSEIVLKAMGRAINKCVMIAEMIKLRIAGLHQNISIGSTDITYTWEPLEGGLLTLETTRHVSMITITLSKEVLDGSSKGDHLPLPGDQVKPWTEFEYNGEGSPPRVHSRGCGGQGKGSGGRGNGNGVESNGDNIWDSGRTYGGKGRGRGRVHSFCRQGMGYGAEDMQKESVGYNELSGSEAPPQLWCVIPECYCGKICYGVLRGVIVGEEGVVVEAKI